MSSSKTGLAIFTSAAVVATFAASGSNATIALGLSYAIVAALAFLLVDKARAEATDGRRVGAPIVYAANGLLAPTDAGSSSAHNESAVIRDVAAAGGLATLVGALALESSNVGSGLAYTTMVDQVLGNDWVVLKATLNVFYAICTVGVHMLVAGTLLSMVSEQIFLSSYLNFLQPSGIALSTLVLDRDTMQAISWQDPRPWRWVAILHLEMWKTEPCRRHCGHSTTH